MYTENLIASVWLMHLNDMKDFGRIIASEHLYTLFVHNEQSTWGGKSGDSRVVVCNRHGEGSGSKQHHFLWNGPLCGVHVPSVQVTFHSLECVLYLIIKS